MEIPADISKFVLSSGDKEKAKYVLFGVPEDGGSEGLAYVEGSKGGPSAIRTASQLYCAFHRKEQGELKTFISNSYAPIANNSIPFFDGGDKKKNEVAKEVASLLEKNQFPITLGGDHSVTYEVLRGVSEKVPKFAVVYFDAHPDFRSSEKAGRKSYATVMCDAQKLSGLEIKKSIQVGVSDIEPEEFENAKLAGIHQITSLEIEQVGIKGTLKLIKKTIGNLPVYISVDLDVLDQSFAPAVSTPSPCGLSSRELLFLLTELSKENIIGLDVMEHTPTRDGDSQTATIGARLIIEFLVRHNTK